MTKRRRGISQRDQGVTPFSPILLQLCENTGAVGAALVDQEGETVDYAGSVAPFDIRVAAAELQIVLDLVVNSRLPSVAGTREVHLRATRSSFLAVRISEGYALVVQLVRHCCGVSHRAMGEAVRDLCREAALAVPGWIDSGPHWVSLQIRPSPGDPRRPDAVWIGGSWTRIEILGRFADHQLLPGEVAYRARLGSGAELTLLREPLGHWYSDEQP
jgi:hypothetical protein